MWIHGCSIEDKSERNKERVGYNEHANTNDVADKITRIHLYTPVRTIPFLCSFLYPLASPVPIRPSPSQTGGGGTNPTNTLDYFSPTFVVSYSNRKALSLSTNLSLFQCCTSGSYFLLSCWNNWKRVRG